MNEYLLVFIREFCYKAPLSKTIILCSDGFCKERWYRNN